MVEYSTHEDATLLFVTAHALNGARVRPTSLKVLPRAVSLDGGETWEVVQENYAPYLLMPHPDGRHHLPQGVRVRRGERIQIEVVNEDDTYAVSVTTVLGTLVDR